VLRRAVFGRVVPASVTITAAAGVGAERSPLLEARTMVDGRATAYVCEHYACRQPVTNAEALREQLDAALAAR
jgi:uncharacterized protein YyaL (SSP411 family)